MRRVISQGQTYNEESFSEYEDAWSLLNTRSNSGVSLWSELHNRNPLGM